MWPFKATAMSGIATCDGEHHHWSAWKHYSQPMKYMHLKTGHTLNYEELRQFRTCIICGFLEDKKVKDE